MCFATFESLLQIDVARVFLINLAFILIFITEVNYSERVYVFSCASSTLIYSHADHVMTGYFNMMITTLSTRCVSLRL
jgi:hypothetical protein